MMYQSLIFTVLFVILGGCHGTNESSKRSYHPISYDHSILPASRAFNQATKYSGVEESDKRVNTLPLTLDARSRLWTNAKGKPSLGENQARGGSEDNEKSWVPGALLHLISLNEQLLIKQASLEDKVSQMDELKQYILGIEKKVSLMDDLKEKVTAIEGKTAQMDMITAKMSDLEAIRDKVTEIDVKVSVSDTLEKLTPALEELTNRIVTSVQSHKAESLAAIKTEHRQFGETLSTSMRKQLQSSCLDTITNVSLALAGSQFNGQQTKDPRVQPAIWWANASAIFKGIVNENLHSIKTDLSSDIKSYFENATHSSSDQVNPAVINTMENIKAAVNQLPAPSTCPRNSLTSARYIAVYYPFNLAGLVRVPLLCETQTLGGGWIVIQRRFTGEIDFYRGWAAYKNGFGSLYGEFWLGLDTIHQITTSGDYELRIELKALRKTAYAHYQKFVVAGESDKYRLTVDKYNGTAGDCMKLHNGMFFSTKDRDNDKNPKHNCANMMTGAWWYRACYDANLNGAFRGAGFKGIVWDHFNNNNPISFSEMKIRRKVFS